VAPKVRLIIREIISEKLERVISPPTAQTDGWTNGQLTIA